MPLKKNPQNSSSSNMRQDTSGQKDQLTELVVFDRLEVGPIKLEPRRLIAPYRLRSRNRDESIDLIYSYEEDVFDPADDSAVNLAGMIAAQVALNYGLFCRSIVFHGLFDNSDRRFIQAMAENTAREIYVKKFLEPNPFLQGKAARLPVIKKPKYLQADLKFAGDSSTSISPKWQFRSTDKNRHCILSSGGKDSLLSFGLLNEIGREVHPIFVNESGRHWFTAINAYKYFKDNIPGTARVWVNSDRIFNWMLRHMPFIRQDYANLRTDEYPIRLWTVAVFLFGALPLLHKRGIGRLIIGDEFDTTHRASFKGVTHYDGLYDQSRYFDEALSRYYLRKGWAISQFSIVRQLSELLIEKILAKRYPHLQEHQVSCHATHKQNDRVYPCGKCEKCRRIVGMLLAVDENPGHCGYTDEQIKNCLDDLSSKKIHQESAGASQLTYMLTRKGLLQEGESLKNVKEHPEILKMRFDPERSLIEGMPQDLREPLYKILLGYSDGAVRRVGRNWIDMAPLTDASLNKPYPFELGSAEEQRTSGKISTMTKNDYLWAELTWPEAEKRLQEVDVAILPVGAIEQHGPHLPLDTDTFDADYLARRVAEACSDPKPLVLSPIPFGVSYHHDEFKGTISISNDTLSHLVYEIGLSAAHNGITKLVIINAHGGNSPALNYAAQMINRDSGIFTCVDTGETSDVDIYNLVETPNDVHAGEFETSTSLAVRPHLVNMKEARKHVPQFSSRYLNFTSKRGISWYAYTRKISSTGVMGDPTKADAKKGKKMWEIMIAHLVAFIEDLKSMTLDEIYQKRY